MPRVPDCPNLSKSRTSLTLRKKVTIAAIRHSRIPEARALLGLTPDVPDATHDLVATHGVGKWLPHFLDQWTPPAPRESQEATKWQLFMQTLAALLSTFGLTKTEEQKIQEAIAEQLKDPTQEPREFRLRRRLRENRVLKSSRMQWRWSKHRTRIRRL